MASPTSPFTATPLNSTTFLIVDTTTPTPHPQIYAKLFNDTILIINTGLPNTHPLPTFLETPTANGPPINASKQEYTIVLTSTHPTHTGNLTAFPATTPLLASPNTHPPIKPTDHLHDTDLFPHVSISESPLTALLTPGITPSSLCIFDPDECVLFVGDLLAPTVVFTLESDIKEYLGSLDKLIEFVHAQGEVEVAASYALGSGDAVTLLEEAKGVLERVLGRVVLPVGKGEGRGGSLLEYSDGKRVAFCGPESVFEEGRRVLGKNL